MNHVQSRTDLGEDARYYEHTSAVNPQFTGLKTTGREYKA